MFNLKSVFVLAAITLSASSFANDAVINSNELMPATITIDTSEVHASISAQLDAEMSSMQQNIDEDMNTMLIAEETSGIITSARAE